MFAVIRKIFAAVKYFFTDYDAVVNARRSGERAGHLYAYSFNQNPEQLRFCYTNTSTAPVVREAYEAAFKQGIQRGEYEKKIAAENLSALSL